MTTSDDELRYWLALLYLPEVGPIRARELLGRFGSPAALFAHGPSDAALTDGLRAALRAPDWVAVERDLAWVDSGGQVVAWDSPDYPPLLSAVAGSPPVLYVHGDARVLAAPQLAVVGSRNPTTLGEETALDFARELAGAGLAIVSGLAFGVDAAAHRGALAGGGHTVAVLGTGPDRVYPAHHRELAHAIVDAGGALVSEFSPGTPPLSGNFPRRNRIISGLALGTLVVEAALHSGSLITARVAAEQGREVFAIPGSIHNPLARGCHRLLRDGAKLVETAADILVELAPQLHAALDRDVIETQEQFPLDAEYRRLFAQVGHEPTPVDRLVERSGLTAEVVSSMLLILELEGYVVAAPGGGYSRTSKESL